MSYNKQTTSSELLIKLIKNEQHQIELDTKEVAELARIVTDYVKRIETVNEVSDVEVISSPPYREIKKKLGELEIANEKMNFRKGLIRDYIHRLYLINGYYLGEWIE